MISDSIKRLETEIAALAGDFQRARELAFPRDLGLEVAKLNFALHQARGRQAAIRHNYLAVCARIGIDPNG